RRLVHRQTFQTLFTIHATPHKYLNQQTPATDERGMVRYYTLSCEDLALFFSVRLRTFLKAILGATARRMLCFLTDYRVSAFLILIRAPFLVQRTPHLGSPSRSSKQMGFFAGRQKMHGD